MPTVRHESSTAPSRPQLRSIYLTMCPPRPRSGSSSSYLLVITWLLCLAGSGQAQTTDVERAADTQRLATCQQNPDCSRHLESAVKFYDQAQYPEALAEYQAAYQLQPYPLILFNIARLHHKQSHLSEAIAYYQRYLDTAHADRAERARLLLAEAKREQAAAATGAEPASPPPAPSASPPPGPPPPQVSAAAATSTRQLSQPPQADKKPAYKRWWLWTLVGVTAAGVATAVALGVYARGPDIAGLQTKTLSFEN